MDKWIPAYFNALEKEIILATKDEQEKPQIHTLFFGGGTPSIVPPREYQKIMQVVRNSFVLADDLEMSFEANPGTIQDKDLSEYRKLGFNRISLGAQSFHANELMLLGRIHTPQETIEAVSAIRQAGFDNLNLDLIYGLPGQTIERWNESIEMALDLHPEHLSLYCLTIEEGTPLEEKVRRGEVFPIDDDVSAEMYEHAMKLLDHSGYRHYEISNWAIRSGGNKDYRCRHNLQYWKNEEYYGFGAGAHGYIRGLRVVNYAEIPNFINNLLHSENALTLYSEVNETSLIERIQDEMMLGLRLIDEGVSAIAFKSKFGMELADIFVKQISQLIDKHLIRWTDGEGSSVALTERGILLGNQVFMEFTVKIRIHALSYQHH